MTFYSLIKIVIIGCCGVRAIKLWDMLLQVNNPGVNYFPVTACLIVFNFLLNSFHYPKKGTENHHGNIHVLSFFVLSLCDLANHSVKQCRTPCALRSSCSECISGGAECMWCSNMRQCVDSNAYVASFPFGQCMEWYTMNSCPRMYSYLTVC